MLIQKKIIWYSVAILILFCTLFLLLFHSPKISDVKSKKIDPSYILEAFKFLTAPLADISFDRDGFSVKFRKDKFYSFLITVIPSKSEQHKLSTPNEVLRFKKSQTLILHSSNFYITICELKHVLNKIPEDISSICHLTDAYLIQSRNKESFAYIFLMKNISNVNKNKIEAFFKNNPQYCTQMIDTYFVVLPEKYVRLLKMVIMGKKELEKKNIKYKKELMQKHNLKTEEEYNKYVKKRQEVYAKEEKKRILRLRELEAKTALANKLKAEELERIRQNRSTTKN